MKISFDLRTIINGRHSGVEEYTINILRELSKNKEDDFLLFYNAFSKKALPRAILRPKNIFLKDFYIPNKILDFFSYFFSLPSLDKLIGGCDVFFSPHFISSSVSSKSKKIVVFHDLSFLYYPEFFSLKQKFWHFIQNPKKQAQKADKIIAISESTKEDLINLYGIKKEKIEVVYSGVDSAFKPLDKNNKTLKKVREKYNLPDKFILYLGTIEPRKNIKGIIRAFEAVRDREDIKLVLAGSFGWLYDDILKEAEKSRFKDDIFFTGFVDQKDKLYIYNLASVFVYPSFFEGFGFPPLEAMACGVPSITSNCSSLPEVVGDAGIMIDPYRPDEIAEACLILLRDIKLRNYFKKKGIKRAKKFSWEDAGKKTYEILKSCV